MSVRQYFLASVCSAFLAASAAVAGAAAATPESKLVSQAYKALQSGDATSAVAAYTRSIESRNLEPEVLANALLNRGLSYQMLNEHERAIDDYTAAMRVDAMSAKLRAVALYNRGLSYQRLQRNAMAMEDFTNALFLDGQFSHAYYSRGVLLRDGGQHLFALSDFDKALRFKYPDVARVHFAEAVAFEKLRRPSDAKNALNLALAANPAYEPAKQRLAILEGRKPAPLLASADPIATAALSQAPKKAPAAVAPSAEMLASSTPAAKPKVVEAKASPKQFTDRVPAELPAQARVVPAAAPAVDAGNAEEKIIAVEELADDPPAKAVAKAPEEAPAAAASQSGWVVQLASAASEDAAWSVWKKMRARHKALASKEPVVVRADLGTKGVFYRVRLIGFDNSADAGSECSKLKSNGVKCYVSKASS